MDYSVLKSCFHPRSVAVIGASSSLANITNLNTILRQGFLGKVYPVNRSGGEVLGLKVYTSLQEIPGPVDFAFVQVSAKVIVDAVKECAAKNIKLAVLYTAGFSESENEWGKELEGELVNVARQGGVHLLGPNCMGLYCPSVRLAFGSDFPIESGPVGAFCQSGGHSNQLVYSGGHRGIRFSQVVSYGNAIDLNEADLMEYFAQDSETKIIIAYIEGARDGRRFYRTLKSAARVKPVIVFNGGQTEAGAATALSHTGSLVGSTELWGSLLKQAGAIQAHSIDECADIALALLFMRPPKGRRLAIMGNGGGNAVQAADDCHRGGLILPPIPPKIKDELKQFIPVAGNIFRNPLDIGGIIAYPEKIIDTVRIIGKWTGIDSLIFNFSIGLSGDTNVELNLVKPGVEAFINAAKEIDRPIAVVAHAVYSDACFRSFSELRKSCAEKGIAFYPSVEKAANAIGKVVQYYERL